MEIDKIGGKNNSLEITAQKGMSGAAARTGKENI